MSSCVGDVERGGADSGVGPTLARPALGEPVAELRVGEGGTGGLRWKTRARPARVSRRRRRRRRGVERTREATAVFHRLRIRFLSASRIADRSAAAARAAWSRTAISLI